MAYIGRDIQYGTFSKQSLTPDGSTVTFTLDQGVADATNLLLSNGGVIQEPNVAYTASGTTLTMSAAPAATDVIWITYLGKELTVVDLTAQSDLAFQVGTGDGSNVNPIATLDRVTPSAESIMVMTDGVTQVPGTDYTVNGTTLTFTSAPANGVKILVYFLGIAQGIGTPSDGTVTDAKIVGMSSSKLTGALPAIDGSALTNMPAELPAAGSSGNLLTSDGASWTSAAGLPAAGSSGNVLTSDGANWASTAPAGGGGLWEYMGTSSFSGVSTVAVTGFTTDYRIEFYSMSFSSGGGNINMVSTADNTNFQTDAQYRYTTVMATSGTGFDSWYQNTVSPMYLSNSGVMSDANTNAYFEVESVDASITTTSTIWLWRGQYINQSGDNRHINGSGQRTEYGSSPHNSSGIRLGVSSGNMTGSYRKYKRIIA